MTTGLEQPPAENRIVPSDGASTPAEREVEAEAQLLSRDLLADGEIVILELKPSLWFIPLVSLPFIVAGVLLVLLANLSIVARYAPEWRWWLWQAGLWTAGLRLAWAALEWYCRIYCLTDRRVIRQMGVLNIRIFECRLDRLQNTFTHRTLLQRIVRVGTVLFATAGTGRVEAAWEHIRSPHDIHRKVAEAIARFNRWKNGGA